jgi:hypothetical protein
MFLSPSLITQKWLTDPNHPSPPPHARLRGPVTFQAPLCLSREIFLTPVLPTLLAKSLVGSATKPLLSVPLQTIKVSEYPYQQLVGLIPYVFQAPENI